MIWLCLFGIHFRKFSGAAFRRDDKILAAKVCRGCREVKWVDLTQKLGNLHPISHMTQGFELPNGIGLTPLKKESDPSTIGP